ncbi:N-acetyltransferase [Polymorphobacter glacialis]|uniref:N-acetyltransferase n=1 Tax=Sandarakinorhabdus glacialis TaxID=1614636 RepID=A0A916ZK18_9SPHN|nr:GNAT family N-acetyltransferase [Polymorphobacter glacialis]GGE01833.1 N-acetyltransferase [Polymorphobacter glacialis]
MISVPSGSIATIVTSLEMLAARAASGPSKSALRLEHWRAPVDRTRYLALFREIGAPWLWRGRLVLDDAMLASILDAPTTGIHIATRRDGTPVGMLELDFRIAGEVEIAYFGLVPGMTGNGHGAWLMAHAMRLAWRPGIGRIWVHTCDLDHPGALGFYQREGFRPFARAVEIYADPRAEGLYPPTVAPHAPLL